MNKEELKVVDKVQLTRIQNNANIKALNFETKQVVIRMPKLLKLSLNKMEAYQIISGAVMSLLAKYSKEPDNKEFVQWSSISELMCSSPLLFKLLTGFHAENEVITLELQRDDLLTLKWYLERRISHCEIERDKYYERFNSDTYIIQRLMLITIREALLGEIIGDWL